MLNEAESAQRRAEEVSNGGKEGQTQSGWWRPSKKDKK
jgi:hypothetical protein